MDTTSLETAFRKAFGAFWGEGAVPDFYDFFAPEAVMIDEDMPFVLDKTAFKDHVDYHLSGIWEWMFWKPRDPTYHVFGDTGLVTANFTYRGKPKSAGFRQRHGVVTVICYVDSATKQWKAGALHLSPLLSHIYHNSPS